MIRSGVRLVAGAPTGYLSADQIVDSDHGDVVALGEQLRGDRAEVDFARAAFTWVRDQVAHSYDAQDPRVTLRASEVLAEGVGLCYAKSHLLAALLRSQGIPAGLCYQRLGDPAGGYFVHGLVAIHLQGAWHRQDPRGNKPGVDAQFSVGTERLAWPVDPSRGEQDYARVFVTPAPEVVVALTATDDILTCALPPRLRSST